MKRFERQQVVEAVAEMAIAIALGERTPNLAELQELAIQCDQHHLRNEAARVRRWMAVPISSPPSLQ